MTESRRPLKSRGTRWAITAAQFLARRKIQPNTISLASLGFSVLAGAAFLLCPSVSVGWRGTCFMIAAAGIQLRLLCNLFDGMVAIESGLKTASGEVFNELPDRFADLIILVGAGYADSSLTWQPVAGWACACLAILTAYVRAFGAALGAGPLFCGPMAKPHRMAVVTLASVGMALQAWMGWSFPLMALALVVVAVGTLVTVWRRTARIVHYLETR